MAEKDETKKNTAQTNPKADEGKALDPEKTKKGKCKGCRHWVLQSLKKSGKGECVNRDSVNFRKKKNAGDSCEDFGAF